MILKRRKRYLQLSLRYEADIYRKIANSNPNYKKIKILKQFFFRQYISKNSFLFNRAKRVKKRTTERLNLTFKESFAYNINAFDPPRRRRKKGYNRDLFVGLKRIQYFYFNIKRHQWRIYSKRKPVNRMFKYKYNINMEMNFFFYKYNLNTTFLSIIEHRLDVILYRSNFAISMSHARQLIQHGHILVNNLVVLSCNFIVKNFAFVMLSNFIENKIRSLILKRISRRKMFPYPPIYLSVDYTLMLAFLNKNPYSDEIPYPFKINNTIIRGLVRYK